MARGRMRKDFLGGNTCLGFYSFFQYVIAKEARRVFILKGGPGSGKSTFMRQIGEELLERGLDLEYHFCSSDSDSIDALTVPHYQLAILDGTEPHLIDPKYPGAVDDIVNLGDYWDQTKLVPYKEQIIALRKSVSHNFATTYSCLKMAKLARDEEISCREKALNYRRFHELAKGLLRQILGQDSFWDDGSPTERHLFASALAPQGIVHYLPTLLEGMTFLYLIEGEPGSGKEILLREVAEHAYRSGCAVEVYHCAFDPTNIDLVVLPEKKTAVLNCFPELDFDCDSLDNLPYCERIDCNGCLENNMLKKYVRELGEAQDLFNSCLQRGLYYLKEVRVVYHEMEGYYQEAMDFEAVEKRRLEVLGSILEEIEFLS